MKPFFSVSSVASDVERSVGDSAQNGTAILAMMIAMAALVLNDTLIKIVSDTLPAGQIMALRGVFATAMLAGIAWVNGALRPIPRRSLTPVVWRAIGEVAATITFLLALFNMPIAIVTAVIQLVPLFVVAGAAIFFGAPVGWRRWLAALVGLAGALLIVRPGTAEFNPYAILALVSVVFVALRDLATRQISPDVSTMTVSVVTAACVTTTGFLMLPLQAWEMPSSLHWALLLLAALAMSVVYITAVLAMRIGDVAVVAPFRYSIVVWAMVSGFVVWGEVPDTLAIVGTLIVIAAGLYTFLRERAILKSDVAQSLNATE